MSFYHEKTTHAARGKWKGILRSFGMAESFLRNQHGPCPMCGGEDRFRWDDAEGRGTYICNACGAGDGMRLAMSFTGMAFSEIAPKIDAILGNIKPEASPQRRDMTDDDRRRLLRETVGATVQATPGDLVDAYLSTRGIDQTEYPKAIRYGASMRDGEGGVRPCMVALVGVHGETNDRGQQRYCSLHRTFLRPDGKGKAEMASPRKMMPGSIPDGACVMLSDWPGYGPIGIAEGIETALAASAIFQMPVWAAINATMMSKWAPPAGAEEVVIFADNDANFTGLKAAATLANKLRLSPETSQIEVNIQHPVITGSDWNDRLLRKMEAPA